MLENNFCTTGVHTLLSCQKAKFRNLRVTPSGLKGHYFLIILKNLRFPIWRVDSFNFSEEISSSVYFTSLILNPPEVIILLASELEEVIWFTVSKLGIWTSPSSIEASAISSGMFFW